MHEHKRSANQQCPSDRHSTFAARQSCRDATCRVGEAKRSASHRWSNPSTTWGEREGRTGASCRQNGRKLLRYEATTTAYAEFAAFPHSVVDGTVHARSYASTAIPSPAVPRECVLPDQQVVSADCRIWPPFARTESLPDLWAAEERPACSSEAFMPLLLLTITFESPRAAGRHRRPTCPLSWCVVVCPSRLNTTKTRNTPESDCVFSSVFSRRPKFSSWITGSKRTTDCATSVLSLLRYCYRLRFFSF